MKKQIRMFAFMALAMFAGIAAVRAEESEIISRVIPIEEFYSKLEIKGDVTVVFVNEPIGKVVLKGDARDVRAIKTSHSNETLVINARKKSSFKKLTVYIPINTVTHMLVNGDSEIISIGAIDIKRLSIRLNGFSEVRLNTEGKICVEAVAGYVLEPLSER